MLIFEPKFLHHPTIPNCMLKMLLGSNANFLCSNFLYNRYFRNQTKLSTKSQPGDAYTRDVYKKNMHTPLWMVY